MDSVLTVKCFNPFSINYVALNKRKWGLDNN